MANAAKIIRSGDEPRQEYEKVFLFLREKLLGGTLRPGDLLLPERELAEHLNVSRPVVREALRALAIMGVVDIRERVGTFVKKPNVAILGDIFAFTLAQDSGVIEDMMQARIAIECQAIRLACQRMSANDLEEISRALLSIKNTIDSTEDGGMADYEFHSTIVQASKSETLISMYQSMRSVFVQLHKDRRGVIDMVPELKSQIIEDHRKIFHALAARDEEQADRQLRSHFKIGDERRYQATLKTALK